MKKIISIIISLLSITISGQILGQNINLESTIVADSVSEQISTQRIEVKTDKFSFKYDYKANGRDVIGLIFPAFWADSLSSLNAMIVKIGDNGRDDQFVLDVWAKRRYKNFEATLEAGRMSSQANDPIDYAGARLSRPQLTIEAYGLVYHSLFGEKIGPKYASYAWIAYHPKNFYIALGKQDRDYWAFFGTKNQKHFGNFTFTNYQPKTKNFWWRSQFGWGEINQGFFNQDLYLEGTSYLVVPVFYYKHFSPICAKGEYSLKLEGRRTGSNQTYELMMGKRIGNDIFRLAVGINSSLLEGQANSLRLAPSFEAYKAWKGKNGQAIVELRYDLLSRIASAYLVFRY
ncbi:MAG: hypothetical protein WC441_03100 [Patescibacteria group bacterium]